MKNLLASSACIFSILLHTTTSFATEAIELRVSHVGDTEMTCGQLSQEAVLMRDIVATTEGIKDDKAMNERGITAAGALGSFLVGTVTGGVGIAAAGFLLKRNNNEASEKVDSVQDIAKQRRSLMVGIYNAKGCEGPVEHAMQDSIMQPSSATLQIASVEPAAGDEHDAPKNHKPHFNQ